MRNRLLEVLSEEFVTAAQWIVEANPWLAGFWMQIIEPQIRGLDDDGVTPGGA